MCLGEKKNLLNYEIVQMGALNAFQSCFNELVTYMLHANHRHLLLHERACMSLLHVFRHTRQCALEFWSWDYLPLC